MADVIDMKAELAKIFKLQKVDGEIYDLKTKKEEIPVILKEMEDSLEEKKGGMRKAEEELKKAQVSKSERETDLKVKEEKIAKHEAELYQIKNNKEYAALKQEIDSIKADVSLIEEDIINFFDTIETALIKCEEEKKIFENEKQNVEKKKRIIENEEKELSDRLCELAAERAEFSGGISQYVLGKYERILENRGNVAIALVNGDFCRECNLQLRPQIINEAKLKKDIVLCENCGRILYAEN